MKKIKAKNIIITLIIASLLAGGVMIYENAQIGIKTHTFRVLSDSFFVGGALIVCVGLFALVSGAGGFDALSFMAHKMTYFFKRNVKQTPSYYDYVEERRAKGKKSIAHFFIVGGAYVLIGLVFAML